MGATVLLEGKFDITEFDNCLFEISTIAASDGIVVSDSKALLVEILLSDGVVASDYQSKMIIKNLSDSMIISETYGRIWVIFRNLSDSIRLSDKEVINYVWFKKFHIVDIWTSTSTEEKDWFQSRWFIDPWFLVVQIESWDKRSRVSDIWRSRVNMGLNWSKKPSVGSTWNKKILPKI